MEWAKFGFRTRHDYQLAREFDSQQESELGQQRELVILANPATRLGEQSWIGVGFIELVPVHSANESGESF